MSEKLTTRIWQTALLVGLGATACGLAENQNADDWPISPCQPRQETYTLAQGQHHFVPSFVADYERKITLINKDGELDIPNDEDFFRGQPNTWIHVDTANGRIVEITELELARGAVEVTLMQMCM